MNNVSRPSGLILVAHEVFRAIPHDEMNAALPVDWQSLPRVVVRLEAVKVALTDLATLDWVSARRAQSSELNNKLKPATEQNPGWRIQYFGAAPIPLATDLGYQISGWLPIDVYQLRHDSNSWAWRGDSPSASAAFKPLELSSEKIAAVGSIVVRVSASHKVDPSETAGIAPNCLGEVDIELVSPHEDAFNSAGDLEALKDQFDQVIDWAHRYRPNAEIHVFASVTVGAAVRMGMAVNPTIHAPVHIYQYSRRSDPRYTEALVLQRVDTPRRILSEEDVSRAATFRKELVGELDRIKEFAQELRQRDEQNAAGTWLSNILPGTTDPFYGPIRQLAKLHDTLLPQSSVDEATTNVPDGFHFAATTRAWQLDDQLLTTIGERFAVAAERQQAGRLLLLHEGVHLRSHSLTEATALEVRRFPKIVEELDYQADTWAFVHDYVLQSRGTVVSDAEARERFIKVIDVAIGTFWAFDAGNDPAWIEIRRINRYLIWYWQLLRIQQCNTIPEILGTLANHPLIEIAGPRVETRDGRVFFSLDPAGFREPEIGLMLGLRIQRAGQSPGSRVRDILVGFRNRDSQQILSALKSVSDQKLV